MIELIGFLYGVFLDKRQNRFDPIYEYIFRKLKDRHCDWRYFFPSIFAIDPKNLEEHSLEDDLENYKPEEEVQKQIERETKGIQAKDLQEELDKAFRAEYENVKYKPLIPLVQAYKNINGHLPEGHLGMRSNKNGLNPPGIQSILQKHQGYYYNRSGLISIQYDPEIKNRLGHF